MDHSLGTVTRSVRLAAVIIGSALALLSWLSPNHYLPWPSFEAQMASAVAALILVFLTLSLGRSSVEWPYLALACVSLAALPWFQYAAGLILFSGDAWLVSGYLAGFGLCQVVGFRLAKQHGLDWLLNRAVLLAIAAALASLFLALYQWFWLGYLGLYAVELAPQQSRAFANFSQPNSFALALIVGSISAAWLYETGRLSGLTTSSLIALFAIGVVLTQSRAAVVIWVLLTAWLALSHARRPYERITLAKILIATGVAAMAYVPWPWLLHYRETVGGLSDARTLEGMVSAGMRPLHWAAMIDAIGRSPWFGYGWNQVVIAQYTVAPDHPVTTELLGDSHNILLDLMVHNGIVVGGAVSGIIFYWFFRQANRARERASSFAFCLVACVCLASMVEFPLNYLFFLLPTGVLIGALGHASEDRTISSPRYVPFVLAACLAALCGAAVVDYHRAEEDLRALRFEQQRIGKPVARTLPSEVLILTQLAAFLEFADMKRGRDDLTPAELRKSEKVVMRYPNWSLLTIFAGDLARNGHADRAADMLRRVCRTQRPEDCELAKVRWSIMSREDERIRRIPFPP